MPVKVLLSAVAIATAVLALGAGGAQAADICWKNPSGGERSTASNWVGNVVPGPDDTATLNGISNGCNIPSTVTMSSNVTIGILSTVAPNRVEVAADKTLTVKGDAHEAAQGEVRRADHADRGRRQQDHRQAHLPHLRGQLEVHQEGAVT